MTMESDLTTLLKAQAAHVFPDFAPAGTAAPWITYQGIGGRALRWLDNTPADKRHTLMQINVWAATRAAALALMRQVEDALCASPAFVVRPTGEPTSTAEEDIPLYGCQQDFDIWSAR